MLEEFIKEFQLLLDKYDAKAIYSSVYDCDENPVGDHCYLVVDGESLFLNDMVQDARIDTY